MNKRHGILIRADAQIVNDVYAAVWNSQEIRKKLFLHNEEFIYQDIRSDSIVVEAADNVGESSELFHKHGFMLFGRRFYGNALIIPDEDRDSPRITPEEVAHRIRFFHKEDAGRGSMEKAHA